MRENEPPPLPIDHRVRRPPVRPDDFLETENPRDALLWFLMIFGFFLLCAVIIAILVEGGIL